MNKFLIKNQISRFLSILILLCLTLSLLCSCGDTTSKTPEVANEEVQIEHKDYASAVKLNMTSATKKQEVTVKMFVDGDTTHFYVPSTVSDTGVLKARYLAINTPESTGKIEEYGKKASEFTKEKLSNASSIIIESDNSEWNIDSTGERYLVWVWYKPNGSDEYRNLNIEILQEGLAIANSSANNIYGSTCMAAIAQAKAEKLNVHSGQKDPDFYYGDAVELTLKELRCNVEDYNGIKVAFEGVIAANGTNTVYVEEFDPDTGLYYGMTVYYGYGLSGDGLNILSLGNRARIVGTVQYYAAGGTYQVSGLTYRQMKPDDPGNIQKISEGHAASYVMTDPETFANGKVDIVTEEETKTYDYAYLTLDTSVSMDNLFVESVSTTVDEDSSSYGAMTLYCKANGVDIAVRTVVLYDEDRNLITEEAFLGKTINVRGVVNFFNGDYQIKVFSKNDITVVD